MTFFKAAVIAAAALSLGACGEVTISSKSDLGVVNGFSKLTVNGAFLEQPRGPGNSIIIYAPYTEVYGAVPVYHYRHGR